MAYEKRLPQRAPEPFTADGGTEGLITVANTLGFKVKQVVILRATGLPTLEYEVKRIDSLTQMWVGPIKGSICKRVDISEYTVALGATVEANEQLRPSVPEQEVERITYEEEPVVARRVFMVDQLGNPYNEDNPVPVNATFDIGDISVNVDLDAKTGDNVSISSHPNPIFHEAVDTITTSNYEEIFSYTSTNDLMRVVAIDSAVSTSSTFRVLLDGVIIREKRSSALEKNIVFYFHEHRPLPSGKKITVEAKIDLVCGRQVWPTYTTFTSMDAYVA